MLIPEQLLEPTHFITVTWIREEKDLGHSTCRIRSWVPSDLTPGTVWDLNCVLLSQIYVPTKDSIFLSGSHLCISVRLNPLTCLLVSIVNQSPFISNQCQSYFGGKKNQVQKACSLPYCSAGCFAMKKEIKWNYPKTSKLLYNWHNRVTKVKRSLLEDRDYFEEWNGWDKNQNLFGKKKKQCDYTIYPVLLTTEANSHILSVI